ncbi:MAG: hypothetical protein JWM81_1129 [Candidatus Saccharibacteria bacterium]|nr:hypothetical protein [Candidatus Saccharibacteria bacterium]
MRHPEVFTPKKLIDRRTAVVITNHLGATVTNHRGQRGHTGREAQAIADASGRQVIAYDRPGTGVRRNKQLAAELRAHPDVARRQWASEVRTVAQDSGARQVHLLSRSAGSDFLLAVAASGDLPLVSAICAVEPMSILPRTGLRGEGRYAFYQHYDEGRFAEERPKFTTEKRDWRETLDMLRRQGVDIAHNRPAWKSDIAYSSARHIAEILFSMPALLVFAQLPLAGPREKIEQLTAGLTTLRRPEDAPFAVEFIPKTTHGSFEDPALYIDQYAKLAQLAFID